MRLVLDTNVLVAAQRSPSGASARLLEGVRQKRITPLISVALFLEYEAVLTRPDHLIAAGITDSDVSRALMAFASVSEAVDIWFALRPSARDSDDDMVVEVAVNGRAEGLVTFETTVFHPALRPFGVKVMTPSEACRMLAA